MDIKSQSLFFVGIKGVAMANLAQIAKQMGARVTGSDLAEEFITDPFLSKSEIHVITSFEPSELPKEIDILIYSAAHGGTQNSQVQEAQKRGISVIHQAQFLAEIVSLSKTSIAVSGCHGKTTTSGLLAFALAKLTNTSSHMVGVSGFNDLAGGMFRGQDYFVFEADEYGMDPPRDITPKFHLVKPSFAVITNIDFDHPDVYSSLSEVQDAYQIFINHILEQNERETPLILSGEDPQLAKLITKLPSDSYLLYGSGVDCDVRYTTISYEENKTRFSITSSYFEIGEVEMEIALFGEKNVQNALVGITVLLLLGFKIDQIRTVIAGYTGPKRRFEMKFQEKGIMCFDDYAHHPTEIEATIKACQSRFPNKKLIVIFQPHTYSRTESFKEAFVETLSLADDVLLLPIFGSARESEAKTSIHSQDLVTLSEHKEMKNFQAFEDRDSLITHLKTRLKPGDIVMTMGAGDVYQLSDRIHELVDSQ